MSSKDSSNKIPEFRSALLRWSDVIALGVLAAVFWHLVYEISFPRLAFSWLLKQPTLIQCVLSAIAALVIIQIQERLHVRLKRAKHSCFLDLKALLYYPPLHISIFTGLILFISMSNAVDIQPLNSNSTLLITVFCFTYGALAFFKQSKPGSKTPTKTSNQSMGSISEEEFGAWLQTDDPKHPIDLLDRKPYVDSIVKRLTDSAPTKTTRGQIIYGPFGSGKSTLVESVFRELTKLQNEEWISCHFDCWGRAENPEALTELLLEEVINAIGQHVNASAIIGIPSEYVAAAYDAQPLFRILAPLLKKRPRDSVLNDVNLILKQNNLKLLLVIENIDRAQNVSLFSSVIGSVLDQVYASDNIRFLFTSGRHSEIAPVASRLADYIEDLSLNTIYKAIPDFIALCVTQTDNDIILPYRDQTGTIYLNRKNICDPEFRSLYIAAASFIDNIRDLKRIMRNTLEMWEIHQGDIFVLDILLYNIYRYNPKLSNEIDRIISDKDASGENKSNQSQTTDYAPMAARTSDDYIQKLSANNPEKSLKIVRMYLLKEGRYNNIYNGINLSLKYNDSKLQSLQSGVKNEDSIQPFLKSVVLLNKQNQSPLMQHYAENGLTSYVNDLNTLLYCYWRGNEAVAKQVCIRALTLNFSLSDENRVRFRNLAYDFVYSSAVTTNDRFQDIIKPALDEFQRSERYEQTIMLTLHGTQRSIDLDLAKSSFEYLVSLDIREFKDINLHICLADFAYLFEERMNDLNRKQCFNHIRAIFDLLKTEMEKDSFWLERYFKEINASSNLLEKLSKVFLSLKDQNDFSDSDLEFIERIELTPLPEKHS